MTHENIKLTLGFLFGFLNLVLFSSSALAETCNIKSGYKLYSVKRNGSLGGKVGNSPTGSYECINTSPYYKRIKIGNQWRYISTEAVVTPPRPVVKPATLNQALSGQLSLNDNYVLRSDSGKIIASTFGVDAKKQNAQVFLDESGQPIKNSDGLVKVQLFTSGRAGTQVGWINPAAMHEFKKIASGKTEIQEDTAIIDIDDNVGNAENISRMNPDRTKDDNIVAPPSTDQDGGADSTEIEVKEGDTIEILAGRTVVPKKSPSLASSNIKVDEPLDEGTDLIATGRRQCDPDSKRCYVEATFPVGKKTSVGWFPEQETSLSPEYHNALRASEYSDSYIIEADDGSLVSEVADADAKKLSESEQLYQSRFTPEDQKRHQELKKAIESMEDLLPKIPHETNRGLVRLHVGAGRSSYCKSYHYADETGTKAGSSGELETYAEPTTACVMAKLSEVWAKEYCPNGGGCRIARGDISHRTLKYFDGHKSHTNGQCIDFRPMRKSGTGALDYNSGSYDQAKTRDFLKLLKRMGGTKIFFNDPTLRKEGHSSYIKGHHNHIHVCFKTSGNSRKPSTADKTCKSYNPDYGFCPELKSLFDNNLMTKFKK